MSDADTLAERLAAKIRKLKVTDAHGRRNCPDGYSEGIEAAACLVDDQDLEFASPAPAGGHVRTVQFQGGDWTIDSNPGDHSITDPSGMIVHRSTSLELTLANFAAVLAQVRTLTDE